MYTVELTALQLQFLTDVVKNAQVIGTVGAANLLSTTEALSQAKSVEGESAN